MKTRKRSEKGFTLIEVLIVVALLGLLAAIAIPNLVGFMEKGAVEAANTEAHNVQITVSSYILASKTDNDENLTGLTGTLGYNGTTEGNLNDDISPYFLTSVSGLQALYTVTHGTISVNDQLFNTPAYSYSISPS